MRVADCLGDVDYADLIMGIDWVTANAVKPAVANISLGGSPSTTVDQALRDSIASGITYGVAAGQNGDTHVAEDACGWSPARVSEAITVGSTRKNDAKAYDSNFGTCLDIFAAPGVGIKSAWSTSDIATRVGSGTSMATPHVVGAAALYLGANPAATPQQVRDALVTALTPNKVTSRGPGSPNRASLHNRRCTDARFCFRCLGPQ